jgi:hypothetical protein
MEIVSRIHDLARAEHKTETLEIIIPGPDLLVPGRLMFRENRPDPKNMPGEGVNQRCSCGREEEPDPSPKKRGGEILF